MSDQALPCQTKLGLVKRFTPSLDLPSRALSGCALPCHALRFELCFDALRPAVLSYGELRQAKRYVSSKVQLRCAKTCKAMPRNTSHFPVRLVKLCRVKPSNLWLAETCRDTLCSDMPRYD